MSLNTFIVVGINTNFMYAIADDMCQSAHSNGKLVQLVRVVLFCVVELVPLLGKSWPS